MSSALAARRDATATREGSAPRTPLVPAGAVATVLVGGMLPVFALWWSDTRPALHTTGDYLTNAGRLAGLAAGYSVAIQLLLMARTPLLERSVGADRLARWHGFGGRWTVTVLVAHAALVTTGYAVTAHRAVVAEIGSLLTSYPDVLEATIALGLLLVTAVLSVRIARRRLPYEVWYGVHLLTYVAIGLAFAHQFANGAEFASHRTARWLWAGLYITVATLAFCYRLVLPAVQLARHQLRVSAVVRESPDVVSIYVSGRRVDDLRADAGQFFRWRFLTSSSWWQSHPYSLSAPPSSDTLRITVKALGNHSAQLAAVRPGVRVMTEGPYGTLTAARRSRRKVLLVAGGIGVTPLRALFETLPARRGRLRMIYRVTRQDDAVLLDELRDIAARRRAHLDVVTSTDAGDRESVAPARLLTLVKDVAAFDVFVCGPPAFVAASRTALRDAGVPSYQVHSEEFAF